DRWDLWELDPAGLKPAAMVTDSVGRTQHLVLRIVQTRRGRGGPAGGGGFGAALFGGAEPIDPAEPLLLRAVDEETKASGFYRDRLGVSSRPEKVVMADAAFGQPIKAESAEEWL